MVGGIIPVPIAPGIADEHRQKLLRIARKLGKHLLYTDSKMLDRLRTFAQATNEEATFKALEPRTFLVERVDDIPSRFIPRAYHEYVRTQDARITRNVVYHNRMDLFTMAVILNRLAANTVDEMPRPDGAEKAFAPAPPGDTMAEPNPPHVPSSRA